MTKLRMIDSQNRTTFVVDATVLGYGQLTKRTAVAYANGENGYLMTFGRLRDGEVIVNEQQPIIGMANLDAARARARKNGYV